MGGESLVDGVHELRGHAMQHDRTEHLWLKRASQLGEDGGGELAARLPPLGGLVADVVANVAADAPGGDRDEARVGGERRVPEEV